MTAQSFRARWILPIDRPPIEGGYVTIRDGAIVAVGAQRPDGPVTDLGDVALLPGLVNAHTHLEFSHLSAPLGERGESIADWIPRVIAARLEGTARAASIAQGMAESLAGGATLVGEIGRPGVDWNAYAGPAARPDSVVFRELIAPTAGGADEFSLEFEGEPPDDARPGLSPHAPYTVHPRLLARAVHESHSRRRPLAMHLAESVEEIALIVNGRGPLAQMMAGRGVDLSELRGLMRSASAYLRILSGGWRTLIVHGNFLGLDDYAFLAEHRGSMSLVHCPRTHEYFEHPPFPLARLLSMGVRVALGTDSRASNPDLSMLNELRAAARQYPDVSPEVLLRMATRDGAAALDDPKRGALAVGAPAEWVTIPVPADDRSEPAEVIVRGQETVAGVYLRDHWVVGGETSRRS